MTLPDPRATFWRRKLPAWMLIIGLAIIIFRMLQGQPEKVQVTYHLGGARVGLKRATIRYVGGGDELSRIRLNFSRSAAEATRQHTVSLVEGHYEVKLELQYPGAPPAALKGVGRHAPAGGGAPGTTGGGTTVSLTRPLIVDGGGGVNIYIVD